MKKTVLISALIIVAASLFFISVRVIVNNLSFLTSVSSAVVKSFLIVHDAAIEANEKLEADVLQTYRLFEEAVIENRENVQSNYELALETQRLTREFREFIALQRAELISIAEGLSIEEAMDISSHDLKRKRDDETPTLFFIKKGRGFDLRDRLEFYIWDVLSLLPEELLERIDVPFNLEGPFQDARGMEITWEYAHFYRTNIIMAITILNKLEYDAMWFELKAVEALYPK